MSLIGQAIKDTYRVHAEVGHGATATVYLAHDQTRNRVVALKAIHPHLAEEGRLLERFRREAELLGKIQSPRVVEVYDFGKEGNVHYLVMEYVEGRTLTRVLEEEGPLPVTRALDITRQVAECLADISRIGVVHRDIKPGNIMVTPKGQIKILDLGIAKILMESGLTQTGVLGTPYYVSPEQAEGRELDVRSDIYSLGVVLFQMLTGRPPYAETSPTAVIMKHLKGDIPDVGELREDVPREVKNLVTQCLAKLPEQRFQTPAELIAALDRIHLPGGDWRSAPAPDPTQPQSAAGVAGPQLQQLRAELQQLHGRVAHLESQSLTGQSPSQLVDKVDRPGWQRAGLLFLAAFVLFLAFLGIVLPTPADVPTVVATPPDLDGPIATGVARQLPGLSASVATAVAQQFLDLADPLATTVAQQFLDLADPLATTVAGQVDARLTAQPPLTVTQTAHELVHQSLWQGENVCFDLIAVLQAQGYTQCLYASSGSPNKATWYATEGCSDEPTIEPTSAQKQGIWQVAVQSEKPVYLKARWKSELPYLVCTK